MAFKKADRTPVDLLGSKPGSGRLAPGRSPAEAGDPDALHPKPDAGWSDAGRNQCTDQIATS